MTTNVMCQGCDLSNTKTHKTGKINWWVKVWGYLKLNDVVVQQQCVELQIRNLSNHVRVSGFKMNFTNKRCENHIVQSVPRIVNIDNLSPCGLDTFVM